MLMGNTPKHACKHTKHTRKPTIYHLVRRRKMRDNTTTCQYRGSGMATHVHGGHSWVQMDTLDEGGMVGTPSTHIYAPCALTNTHANDLCTWSKIHMNTNLATSTHTRSEVHGCPLMVGIGAVGQFGVGGHANKAWDCPQRPGRRYLPSMAKTIKQQTKKKHSKTSQNKHKQRHISTTKGQASEVMSIGSPKAKEAQQKGQGSNTRNRPKRHEQENGHPKQQKCQHAILGSE